MAKTLQLLRNQTLFTDKATALENLKAKLVSAEPQLAAGEPLIASYTDGEGDKVGILLAISHGDGKNYQIFEGSKLSADGETLEIPQEVQDAINDAVEGIIGEASDGYDTLGKIEDLVTAQDTKISGLQSELDATQVGAGLSENGSYAHETGSNYIDAATSLKVADKLLDTFLKAEETARITKDNELNDKLEALSATVTKNKVVAGLGITVNTEGVNTVVSAKVKTDNNALKVDATDGLYVDESALEKYQGSNAIAVSEAQKGVKTISLTIDPSDKVLSQSAAGLKTSIQIVKLGTPSGDTIREEFKLVGSDGTTQLGETIKIYKDQSLQSAELTQDDNGDDVLRLTYNLANGTTSVVDINVDDFLREAEFGNGLQVVDGEVSIKLADGNEGFLTVGANGVKLDGVQTAIDQAETDAITTIKGGAVDYPTLGSVETKLDGIDTKLTSIDGYTVNTKPISENPVLNGADIALTGYERSKAENDDLQLKVTDTVNGAFGKLEKAILDNEEVCSKAFDAVATAVGLNRTGMTYVAPEGSNYLSDAESVKDADSKLDAAIKAVEERVAAEVGKAYLDGVVAGNGIAVTEKANNKQTISAKAVAADPIIEVTENGIGSKADAIWDCGFYD